MSDSPCEALMPGIDYHQLRQQISMPQVLDRNRSRVGVLMFWFVGVRN